MSRHDAFDHYPQNTTALRLLHEAAEKGLRDKGTRTIVAPPPGQIKDCLLGCLQLPSSCEARQRSLGKGHPKMSRCEPCNHYLFRGERPHKATASRSNRYHGLGSDPKKCKTLLGWLRVTQRLNQETLARHLHISESDISELETGRKNIKLVRPVVREKLEEFFELSLAELLAKPKEVEEWVSGTSVGGWML